MNLQACESACTGCGRTQVTSRKDIMPSTAFNCFMQIEAATCSAEHELSTTTACREEPQTMGTPLTVTIQPETDRFFGPTAKEASACASCPRGRSMSSPRHPPLFPPWGRCRSLDRGGSFSFSVRRHTGISVSVCADGVGDARKHGGQRTGTYSAPTRSVVH